mmetsp:Transcript_5002/g.12838  ORF Transcript_5002/g.12838 Transcript_5002/m.12838 type:complete len:236 (-) Transcript_5002:160-867(-)
MTTEGNADALLTEVWEELQLQIRGDNSDVGSPVRLSNHLKSGYTTDEASQVRELVHNDAFNVVPPPVDCPSWLCIVLPCINHLKSMKAHKNCIPEDAEVLRNGKWMRYDAASLVIGDVIRLEEGDVVPADCVLALDKDHQGDFLVDLRVVTGKTRPKQFNMNEIKTRKQRTLLYGGTVVQGYATAFVTAIGTETILSKLIRNGKFPLPEKNNENEEVLMDDGNAKMKAMEMGTLS